LNDGRSKEEWKGQAESNKILSGFFDSVKVDGLCVRIGTMRSHSQALTIKLKKDLSIDKINNLISRGNQWVKLIDNNKEDSIKKLTPAAVSGTLDIAIGRVRLLNLDKNLISAFTVGDQLLWGAAEPLRRMMNILIQKEG
jgi:aspartate-semialdehyde dehydrogenase